MNEINICSTESIHPISLSVEVGANALHGLNKNLLFNCNGAQNNIHINYINIFLPYW